MHYFEYRSGELYCENVPLDKIAAEVGTPTYIYSEQTLHRHVRVFDEAFQSVPHLICYAVKANSNINLLRRLRNGEPASTSFPAANCFAYCAPAVPQKRSSLPASARQPKRFATLWMPGILFFNVESSAELELIHAIARDMQRRARVSIRANPDVDPRTHPYISTGMQKHKFGVSLPEARELYRTVRAFENIDVVGVQCHLGSQITEMGPFEEALASLRQFVLELKADGMNLKYLDFGGGLGISYNAEEPPSPAVYGNAVAKATRDLGVTIVLEPGRVIVGNAGILLTRVLLKKSQGAKKFLVVDAGMNDLIRPALYGSHHQLWPVRGQTAKDSRETVDVVGPVCESADFIAKDERNRRPRSRRTARRHERGRVRFQPLL